MAEDEADVGAKRFNNNKNNMFAGCGQYNVAADSGPEVGAIYDGIQAIATQGKVDHRLILAVIMQESSGCVRGECLFLLFLRCSLSQGVVDFQS